LFRSSGRRCPCLSETAAVVRAADRSTKNSRLRTSKSTCGSPPPGPVTASKAAGTKLNFSTVKNALESASLVNISEPLPNQTPLRNSRKARQRELPGRSESFSYCNLISCFVTVLVSGLAVKRITAVSLVSGRSPPVPPPPAGGVVLPDDDGELEPDDVPVPT